MLQDGFSHSSVLEAANVMTILALSKLPSLYIAPCLSVLAAMGYVRFNSTRSVFEAVANVILSLTFVMVLKWGLAGVAAGTLVARLLVGSVSVPLFLCRKAAISGRSFIIYALFPGIISAILFSLTCFAITFFWPPDTWFKFGVHVLTAVSFWGLIAIVFLVPTEFRQKWYEVARGRIVKVCLSR